MSRTKKLLKKIFKGLRGGDILLLDKKGFLKNIDDELLRELRALEKNYEKLFLAKGETDGLAAARIKELEALTECCVPLSADGKFVFIDGLGDVALMPKEGPDIQVKVEYMSGGVVHGSALVDAIRVEHEEDASYTAVISDDALDLQASHRYDNLVAAIMKEKGEQEVALQAAIADGRRLNEYSHREAIGVLDRLLAPLGEAAVGQARVVQAARAWASSTSPEERVGREVVLQQAVEGLDGV